MSSKMNPLNSQLSIKSERFRVSARQPNKGKYTLFVKGDELSAAWIEDHQVDPNPIVFDDITGKSVWEQLFNGEKPNSVLSGKGNSLAFKSGHFRASGNGTYASKVRLIGNHGNQDEITGQWRKSSLVINSDSDPEDGSNTIVEGLAGLLVVGGGLVLYKKIRANRVQEAADSRIEELNANIQKAKDDWLKGASELQENENALKASTEQLNELQIKLRSYQESLANAEEQLRLSKQYGDEKAIKLWEKEVNDWNEDIMSTQEKILSVEAENKEMLAKSSDILQEMKAVKNDIKDLRDQKNGVQRLEKIIEEEFEEDLDEVANEENPYTTDAFKNSESALQEGDLDNVKLYDQIISEQAEEYETQLMKAVENSFGDGFTESMKKSVKDIISEGQNSAYDALVDATCTLPVLATGGKRKKETLGSGLCAELDGIDPIVDLYAEEFTIEENMIFKGSHVFQEFRSDLAEIGYESEIEELTDYVAGPEFAGEAGDLIGLAAEGSLVGEEAVGALDIASIGLGGEAFVDGLALEVGGDALLGEIALDILEIALIF